MGIGTRIGTTEAKKGRKEEEEKTRRWAGRNRITHDLLSNSKVHDSRNM